MLIVLMVLFSPQKASEDVFIFCMVMYDLSRRIYEWRDWMIYYCFSMTLMKSKQTERPADNVFDWLISQFKLLPVVFI